MKATYEYDPATLEDVPADEFETMMGRMFARDFEGDTLAFRRLNCLGVKVGLDGLDAEPMSAEYERTKADIERLGEEAWEACL